MASKQKMLKKNTIEFDIGQDGWAENFPCLVFPESDMNPLYSVESFLSDVAHYVPPRQTARKTKSQPLPPPEPTQRDFKNLSIKSRNSTNRNQIALLLNDLNVDDIIIQYYFFHDGSEAHRYVRILAKQGGHITATVHKHYDRAADSQLGDEIDKIEANDTEVMSVLTKEIRQLRIAIEGLQKFLVETRRDSPGSGIQLQ